MNFTHIFLCFLFRNTSIYTWIHQRLLHVMRRLDFCRYLLQAIATKLLIPHLYLLLIWILIMQLRYIFYFHIIFKIKYHSDTCMILFFGKLLRSRYFSFTSRLILLNQKIYPPKYQDRFTYDSKLNILNRFSTTNYFW